MSSLPPHIQAACKSQEEMDLLELVANQSRHAGLSYKEQCALDLVGRYLYAAENNLPEAQTLRAEIHEMEQELQDDKRKKQSESAERQAKAKERSKATTEGERHQGESGQSDPGMLGVDRLDVVLTQAGGGLCYQEQVALDAMGEYLHAMQNRLPGVPELHKRVVELEAGLVATKTEREARRAAYYAALEARGEGHMGSGGWVWGKRSE